MTSNTSKWQATHKFLLFFMILTVFHEFLPFFTNLSWQAINLWKIGEICEKTVKIMKNRRNLWKNCQNQRNSWKNTFLGQTRRNLVPNNTTGNKSICKVTRWEMKKKLSSGTLFCISYVKVKNILKQFMSVVCLINFLTLFPSRYFKSKHRFEIVGLSLR